MNSNPDNELAARLEQGFSSVQSVLPVLLGGLAILLVGSVGWGLYSSSEKKKQALAWTEFYFITEEGGAASFESLADDYPNSTMSGWARLASADDYLKLGVDLMYTNRSLATEELGKAKAAYQAAYDSSSEDELRSKAALGLARVHESLGELDQATKFYEEFTSLNQIGALNQMATERLTFLQSDEGKEFYAWFSKLDPKPADPINLPSDISVPPTGPGGLDFSPTAPLSPLAPGGLDPTGLPSLSDEDAAAAEGGETEEGGNEESAESTDASESSELSLEPATSDTPQASQDSPESDKPE